MADAFLAYNSTCPANTLTTAPSKALNVGAAIWQVVKVSIVIPAGHAGLTGIQLWFGGGAAIPYNGGWFSGDDDVIHLEVGNAFPVGVPWSVAMINADVQAHSWQTRWEMDYVNTNAQTVPPPAIAVSDIYAAAATVPNTESQDVTLSAT